MNKPLRRVGIAVMAMIVLLLANTTYVQVIQGDTYRNDPRNVRILLDEYSRQRGFIVDAAGNTIAGVQATNDRLKFLRTYLNGPLYAPVTGYFSTVYGSTGIERAENDVLNGSDDRLFVRRLSDLITGRDPRGGTVQLTIDPRVQQAAYDVMTQRGFTGAAVAIRPSTGEILALVNNPSYDPGPLAAHDSATQTKAYQSYQPQSPTSPMVNQALSAAYQPGSTFKLVVAAAALSGGIADENTPSLPADPTITLPGTRTQLSNFGNEPCGGSVGGQVSMKSAIAFSCNTAFATLGGKVGAQALIAQAAKFGFGQQFQVPMTTVASCLGSSLNGSCMAIKNGLPGVYQSGIGQLDVQETPLQNALITATIANGGREMRPQLVKNILAQDLSTISVFSPDVMNDNVMSSDVARTITDMMQASEQHSSIQPAVTVPVVSKTGTAEHGPDPKNTQPYGWYDAFAPNNDIAVSVVVTSGGSLDLATVGAKVAGPVGHAMINAFTGGG